MPLKTPCSSEPLPILGENFIGELLPGGRIFTVHKLEIPLDQSFHVVVKSPGPGSWNACHSFRLCDVFLGEQVKVRTGRFCSREEVFRFPDSMSQNGGGYPLIIQGRPFSFSICTLCRKTSFSVHQRAIFMVIGPLSRSGAFLTR